MKPPRCPRCGGCSFSKRMIEGRGNIYHIQFDIRWEDKDVPLDIYGPWVCGICDYTVVEQSFLFEELTTYFDTRPTNVKPKQ